MRLQQGGQTSRRSGSSMSRCRDVGSPQMAHVGGGAERPNRRAIQANTQPSALYCSMQSPNEQHRAQTSTTTPTTLPRRSHIGDLRGMVVRGRGRTVEPLSLAQEAA